MLTVCDVFTDCFKVRRIYGPKLVIAIGSKAAKTTRRRYQGRRRRQRQQRGGLRDFASSQTPAERGTLRGSGRCSDGYGKRNFGTWEARI